MNETVSTFGGKRKNLELIFVGKGNNFLSDASIKRLNG